MRTHLSSPWFALMCHWGRIASPSPFPRSQLAACLQGMLGKVALEEYSGISAAVAEGWGSAWMLVCLCETFLSLGSNVWFYNPRALGEGKLSVPLCSCITSWKIFVCLCFCGLKGGFCRFHLILESALPWWGSCFYSLCRNSGRHCDGRVVLGISAALGALRN